MGKFQICQFTLCYLPVCGGQEVYVDQLSELISKHTKSLVIQSYPRGINQKNLESLNEDVLFVKIPRGLNKINNIFPYLFFREKSKKFLNKFPKDTLNILHYASLFSKKQHDPQKTIIISHGKDWDNSITGKYRFKKLCDAYNAGCAIVCNDSEVANILSLHFKLGYEFDLVNKSHKKITFIPNTFNQKEFYFLNQENVFNNNYFLLARNLRKSRGIDTAIFAFDIYRRNGGKKTLKIAGGPLSGSYFRQLKEMIKDLSLEDSIEFIGSQERYLMPQLYRNACMSIVPSKAYEGTSISALESMAVGCPCASTNIGGLKDLPTEKFDNVEELATLMHNCLDFDREEIAKKVSPFSPSNWNIQWEQVLGFLN